MKIISLFMLAMITMLTACSEKQLIHKEIKVRDVIVRWYSTSAISSTRGFVDVNYDGQWTNVLNCNDGSITDVNIDNGIIRIKSYKPNELIYDSKSRIGSLKIQQVPASTKEWLHYYQPEFEKSVK